MFWSLGVDLFFFSTISHNHTLFKLAIIFFFSSQVCFAYNVKWKAIFSYLKSKNYFKNSFKLFFIYLRYLKLKAPFLKLSRDLVYMDYYSRQYLMKYAGKTTLVHKNLHLKVLCRSFFVLKCF